MILNAILLSLMAGLAIPLGALLAYSNILDKVWARDEIRHGIIGLGAGALVAAVALVLIPEGAQMQSEVSVLVTFLVGGVAFMLIDQYLSRKGGSLSNFLAMMLDFVPEAIVVGAIIVESYSKAVFIAIIIAVQNFPEGYASFLEMRKGKLSSGKLLLMFLAVGLTGPLYILLGISVFSDLENMLGVLMTFCAGGILYLVFEDVAPRIAMKNHWSPPLGTVIGFSIGLIGYLYT